MTANVWSPNLKSIITQLIELQPLKRRTLLLDQQFLQATKLSIKEQQLVRKVFTKTQLTTQTQQWI